MKTLSIVASFIVCMVVGIREGNAQNQWPTNSPQQTCSTSTNPEVLRSCQAQKRDLQNRRTYDGALPSSKDPRYVFVDTIYLANGQMAYNGVGLVFNIAEECDKYVSRAIEQAQIKNSFAAELVANSVLVTKDGSGYLWYGCIHADETLSGAFIKYIQGPMTPERARTMKRFPNFRGAAP